MADELIRSCSFVKRENLTGLTTGDFLYFLDFVSGRPPSHSKIRRQGKCCCYVAVHFSGHYSVVFLLKNLILMLSSFSPFFIVINFHLLFIIIFFYDFSKKERKKTKPKIRVEENVFLLQESH